MRIAFAVVPSDVDEMPRGGESPSELVRRLAADKAIAVSRESPDAFVLGADTVVVIDGEILGKPRDDAEAIAMLERLSGQWHDVLTGVALVRDAQLLEGVVAATRVRFAALDRELVEAYVATGEGRDKAGAYAVQGIASGLVEEIQGSYSNVVGLPAALAVRVLRRHGALEAWP